MMASVLLAACLLAAVTRAAVSPADTVYIIRHGEKTWALGCLDDLGKARAASLPSVFNSKPSPSHATFQTPAALFANQVRHDKLGRANPSHRELELLLLRLQPLRLQPKHQQQSVGSGSTSSHLVVLIATLRSCSPQYDDPVDCERCKQTLEPIAAALNLPLIFDYGYPAKLGGNLLAASAIRNASLAAGVVLVAWEHLNIQYLTADLGVPTAKIPHWEDSDYDTVYTLTM